MKTKFSPILRLKKEALDAAERDLVRLNGEIALLQNEIAALKNEIAALKTPQNANYAAFMLFRSAADALAATIEKKNTALDSLKGRKNALERAYQAALREYEKIKYLHEEEVALRRQKIARAEAAALDEYGSILHFAKGGGE